VIKEIWPIKLIEEMRGAVVISSKGGVVVAGPSEVRSRKKPAGGPGGCGAPFAPPREGASGFFPAT
jgi:hypothetical protein